MIRRIAAQHGRLLGHRRIGQPVGDLPGALGGVSGVVTVVRREPGIAQHGEAVGVPEEKPAADGGAAVDGVMGAQPAVEGVRPFPDGAKEGVEQRVEDVPGLPALDGGRGAHPCELAPDANRSAERPHPFFIANRPQPDQSRPERSGRLR